MSNNKGTEAELSEITYNQQPRAGRAIPARLTMTSQKTKFILRLMRLERKLKNGYMAYVASHGKNVTFGIVKRGDTERLVSVFCTPVAYATTEAQQNTIAEIETRADWQPYFQN